MPMLHDEHQQAPTSSCWFPEQVLVGLSGYKQYFHMLFVGVVFSHVSCVSACQQVSTGGNR